MNSETVPVPWYANLMLVVGVFLTVVMALLMSQLDRLQTRLVPTVQVVAQATEPVMTPTPLSAIALATAVPASPSPLPSGDESTTVAGTAVPTITCGQPPVGWVAYIVQAGDTLYALSIATGASIDQIVQVNCLDAQLFVTGMQIFLPTPPPRRIVCGPPGWWVRYTVQPGDTLSSLARSRGTTISQIMNANCMVSFQLYWGRQIYLPPGGATAVPTNTPLPPATKEPRPTKTAVPPTSTATPPPVATIAPTSLPRRHPPPPIHRCHLHRPIRANNTHANEYIGITHRPIRYRPHQLIRRCPPRQLIHRYPPTSTNTSTAVPHQPIRRCRLHH
ncbi:MAG: LysM peptidoglycan-binding domain-containing protein [Ardenticatenaceae bacterium]|nr:LysM peptidoglycan-binding domain-containing protein [Ardenticatenaceae bacterium]